MEYTQEQKDDFTSRALEFKAAFEDLKTKHQCEFVYAVVTVPSTSGVFGLAVSESLGDTKFKAKPATEPTESIIKEA